MENNYFALLANDMKKLWNGLDVPQKLGMLFLIVLTIIAATFFLSKALEPDWVVLYSDLSEVDTLNIVEGMKRAISGETVEAVAEPTASRKHIDLDAFTEDSVLEFGYCTEFLLRLQKAKIDIDSFDIDALIDWLNSVGDSVVAFREGTVVKVHVHTKKPGDVFNYVQQFGEFLTMKVENMTLQHNETHSQKEFVPQKQKPHKQYGIVSVAAGEGIKETFLSLGCDYVVDGGQSMNPSAEDMISAFNEVNAGGRPV